MSGMKDRRYSSTVFFPSLSIFLKFINTIKSCNAVLASMNLIKSVIGFPPSFLGKFPLYSFHKLF